MCLSLTFGRISCTMNSNTNSIQIKFASNSTKRPSGHRVTMPRKIREVVNFILTWPPCQIWNLFSWFGQNRFRKSSVLQDVDLLWCSKTQMGHVMWGGEVWNRMCSTYAKQEMKQPRKDVLFEFNPVPQISLEKPLLKIQDSMFQDFDQISAFRFSAPK